MTDLEKPPEQDVPEPLEKEEFVAVFGGAARRGRWRVPRRSEAVAVFGGVDLDLTDAVLPPGTSEIEAVAVFGGVDIFVPDGVTVRSTGVGVFGFFGTHDRLTDDPGAPVLIVRGAAVFGEVTVRRGPWRG